MKNKIYENTLLLKNNSLIVQTNLSVIIIAYKKRDYIIEAIESAINQNLDEYKIEIILIKNFREQIDVKFASHIKIIEAEDDEISIGSKIVRAAEESKATYLSFLEDDDIFFPQKLKWIINKFQNDKDIVYIHNDQTYIYSDNKHYESKNNKKLHQNKISSIVIDIESLSSKNYFNFKPDFNLSSISMRKDIILKNRDIIIDKTFMVDTLLFVLSLINGGKALICTKPLTGYRFHQSNLSIKENYLNKNESLNYLKYLNNVTQSSLFMFKMAIGTKIEGFTGRNYYSASIMRDMFSRAKRINFIKNIYGLLKYLDLYYLKRRLDIYFYGTLSILSSSMAFFVYKLIHI
ncbi:MAG: glycosyltransferase family 2 protein, partial [Thermoplasmataceae archaeon]